MKRVAVLLLGIIALVSFSGCCMWPWYGCGYGGSGYGSSGYSGGSPGCWGGACGMSPQPGAVVPQGSSYMTYDTYQASYPPAAPVMAMPAPMYPTVSMGPVEPLPTYR